MKINEFALELLSEARGAEAIPTIDEFAIKLARETLKMAMRINSEQDTTDWANQKIQAILDGKVELPEVGEDE